MWLGLQQKQPHHCTNPDLPPSPPLGRVKFPSCTGGCSNAPSYLRDIFPEKPTLKVNCSRFSFCQSLHHLQWTIKWPRLFGVTQGGATFSGSKVLVVSHLLSSIEIITSGQSEAGIAGQWPIRGQHLPCHKDHYLVRSLMFRCPPCTHATHPG